MTVANDHDEPTEGEASWLSPLYAFIAIIAAIFDQITKLKRARPTTKFRSNWRDHWPDLRQCEWLRDQVIAHGLASLLAGKDLDLNPTLIMDPPDDYGARCPRTPFAMNQRFLAVAQWTTNPEAIIRKRYKRFVKRFGANPLASHGSTDAAHCAAAQHELVGVALSKAAEAKEALILSSAHRARPSTCRAEAQRRRKNGRVLPAARDPPLSTFVTLNASPPKPPAFGNAPPWPQRPEILQNPRMFRPRRLNPVPG